MADPINNQLTDAIGHPDSTIPSIDVPIAKERLDQLVDACLYAIVLHTTLVQAKQFDLRESNSADYIAVLYQPNGRTYAFVDRLNTTAHERTALISSLTSSLIAAGLTLDRTFSAGSVESIHVIPPETSPLIQEFIAKMDLIRPKVTTIAAATASVDRSSTGDSASSSSGAASTVVSERTRQIVDAVYRTILTIPKFQDAATQFALYALFNGYHTFELFLADGRWFCLGGIHFTDDTQFRTVLDDVRSRLVTSGFPHNDTISFACFKNPVTNLQILSPTELVASNPSSPAGASSASGSGTGVSSSASSAAAAAANVVAEHTQQIADGVFRAIMSIPKFKDMTRFDVDEARHTGSGFFLFTEDERRYVIDGIAFRDAAERKTVKEIVTSHLIANGFQLDDSISGRGPFIRLSVCPFEPTELVAPKPNAQPAIVDHASFFRALRLTDAQIRRVKKDMPVDAPTDDLFWLSCFDVDMLYANDLSRTQANAWQKLIAKLLP